MKINDTNRVGAFNPYARNQAASSHGTSGKKSMGKDEVQISAEAKELLDAREPERQKRIEELKQAVSAGTYQVDARKLAEKLLPFIK
ncbi:anti-sigma-28 factor, FlgM family [Paenibacillus larvae subsp. larvae]|uniref:Negative regulator of flagellin synthesis n=3 Tax=Paenibacillus larvae TaxID=1464 RepID=V9W206_9BACL|nr:flagellar biosynthesis anti-sigma factor FlgM [Paenibacillus larvae]AHD03984.1 anti-sigma-28 factor, FlgM family [Paenibacillus larvae subsp. larvae DSM 25430]AQT85089.1 flagellar biosynthesis anti-sigma factor FlgM [Paenibacillus larvae subsp. pulvifaciens]AQZ47092.1 flagellar biosynthesis anti-sigma factor FlgM [Paenibacillus larvae subsp. pulvifaciens]ARF68467.1 flagellar biosynthesis anti-sigma factor FlgM [Paenibacillus larvae subsp. pulvifaciens]AVF24372.1 anti-sigma-28 factor, FlgM f